MDQELLDLLARLQDETQSNPLTDEELARVEAALVEHASSVTPAEATAEDIELLTLVSQYLEAVRTEAGTRAEAAAERESTAAALMESIRPAATGESTEGESTEGEGEGEGSEGATGTETEGAEGTETGSTEGTETEGAEGREPVAASAGQAPGEGLRPARLPSISRLAARRPERA
ncbi:MAG: hypothetical protein ACRDXE_10755, partial [Acidimicrobiales bacterium]